MIMFDLTVACEIMIQNNGTIFATLRKPSDLPSAFLGLEPNS